MPKTTNLQLKNPIRCPYKVGEEVCHDKYGPSIVQDITYQIEHPFAPVTMRCKSIYTSQENTCRIETWYKADPTTEICEINRHKLVAVLNIDTKQKEYEWIKLPTDSLPAQMYRNTKGAIS